MSLNPRLDGKVALVTGAARGTGEAIARHFAAEGARLGARDGAADGRPLGAGDGDCDGCPDGGTDGARVMTSHTCATCARHPAVHTHPDRQSHVHSVFATA